VAAAKVVPPAMSAEAMQAVAESGWPPGETATLGDWVLRASGGVTGRANSVRVAGRPGMPLGDALERVSQWYAARDLPPLVQVPVPSAYDDDLAARGWEVARRTVLLTAATAGVRRLAATASGVVLERSTTPSPEWLALVEPDLDPEAVARILVRPAEVVFVSARDASTGALLGTGRASASGAAVGRWAGVTSILTAPQARRRGVASTVMGALAAWADEHRCAHTYLQVLARNEAAHGLYDALGYRRHHAYEYLSPQRVSPR
jgi:GNAT superfamily N-acetyltransferase